MLVKIHSFYQGNNATRESEEEEEDGERRGGGNTVKCEGSRREPSHWRREKYDMYVQ